MKYLYIVNAEIVALMTRNRNNAIDWQKYGMNIVKIRDLSWQKTIEGVIHSLIPISDEVKFNSHLERLGILVDEIEGGSISVLAESDINDVKALLVP